MLTALEPEREVMAKKRTAPQPSAPKGTVFSIKGSPEWRDWMAMLADHARTDMAKLVDSLLVEYARKHNLPSPPRR